MCIHVTLGVEIGFNQSYLTATEGQSEGIDVCVEITAGRLERNVTVYLDTVSEVGGGKWITIIQRTLSAIYIVIVMKITSFTHEL